LIEATLLMSCIRSLMNKFLSPNQASNLV
jgi:hypothetical protein